MVYASYRVLCVWMVFFRVVCEWFTPHTAFYVFGRSSFELCVNTLRLMPRCMRSERFSRDDTVTVLRMFRPVVRLPGRRGTVYRDA
jgi:hypothetical protein